MDKSEFPPQVDKSRTRNFSDIFIVRTPWWKRLLDIVGSGAALLFLSPLLIAVYLAIVLTSGRPAIYRQQRAGLGGRPFTLFKFRSMVLDADALQKELLKYNERTGPAFKMKNDPRVTRIGRIIRKLSIDELPQFINVFIGNMSLVGPRPLPLEEDYTSAQWHRARRLVKPGITCLWQVHSRYSKDFNNWVRLDIYYSRHLSFWLDVKILAITLPAVLLGRDMPLEWTIKKRNE